MKQHRARVGRPSKAAKPGQKATLGIRAAPALKHRLDAAAQANDRSLSQEAELRLERSFQTEELLPSILDLHYGRQLAALLMLIGGTLKDTGPTASFLEKLTHDAPSDWLGSAYAVAQVESALKTLIAAFRPDGAAATPKFVADAFGENYDHLGEGIANGYIDALLGRGATAEQKAIGDAARERLGPLAEQLRERLKAKGGAS